MTRYFDQKTVLSFYKVPLFERIKRDQRNLTHFTVWRYVCKSKYLWHQIKWYLWIRIFHLERKRYMQGKQLRKSEAELWRAADQLRANSKLTASEYSMPVLGLIFLRHAYNRFQKVKIEVEKTLPSHPLRGILPLTKKDFEDRIWQFNKRSFWIDLEFETTKHQTSRGKRYFIA